ncbi:LysM peptidoglycan-binding domain-containing protein, partial [Bradyrhizobium sp.]|uniref:LysM peptidoglycan-binding domain-containing protein n=1 Tax=Bradyrhizobium sp. TaxID=376 RepID=UPI003C453E1B
MSRIAELRCARRLPQVAVLALVSFSFAGCSADMSTRVAQAQNSFSNPFAGQPEATGALPPQPPAPIERRDLSQNSRPQPSYQPQAYQPQAYRPSGYQPSGYQSSGGAPLVAAPQSYPSASVSGGGRGVASYTPPPQPRLESTGSVAPRSVAAVHPQAGATIIVGTSDTLEILAQRYHVTPAAILAANGYKGPRTLSPGQQLIIPRQTAVAAAAPVVA